MDAAQRIMADGRISYEREPVDGPTAGDLTHWLCRYADADGRVLTVPFSGNVPPEPTLVLQCLGSDLADVAATSSPEELAEAWNVGVEDAKETMGWLGRMRASAEGLLGSASVATLVDEAGTRDVTALTP